MSILLDANTEYISHNYAGLDGLDSITIIMIYMMVSTAADPEYVASKGLADATDDSVAVFRPKLTSKWSFQHVREFTNSFFESSAGLIVQNRWEWIAVLDSDGTAPVLLHGTLTGRPAEPSYASRTTGSGSPFGDSATAWQFGRRFNATNQGNCRLAFAGISNRRMSVAEALTHWPRPRMVPGAGWVLLTHPGLHGTLSAVDLSGGKRNGTVNGTATLTPRPPLPFPRLRTAS